MCIRDRASSTYFQWRPVHCSVFTSNSSTRRYCFHDLAKFKRVYKVEMSDANVGGEIRKVGYIDLMNIQDPKRLAKKPLTGGVLTFPFFTIENVDIVDSTHIVVGNDNNLPFSSSRDPNKADDNELVLLEVGELLRAR